VVRLFFLDGLELKDTNNEVPVSHHRPTSASMLRKHKPRNANATKGRVGSSVSDYLSEQGPVSESTSIAIKRVIAFHYSQFAVPMVSARRYHHCLLFVNDTTSTFLRSQTSFKPLAENLEQLWPMVARSGDYLGA
jgi:hypothetical protein